MDKYNMCEIVFKCAVASDQEHEMCSFFSPKNDGKCLHKNEITGYCENREAIEEEVENDNQ